MALAWPLAIYSALAYYWQLCIGCIGCKAFFSLDMLCVPGAACSGISEICSCHLSVSEFQENTKRQEKPRGFSAILHSAAASATVFGRWFHLLGMEIKPGKDPASSSMDFPLLGTCWLNWEKLRQRHPFNHQLFRGLGGGCGKRTCGSWVGPGRVEEVVGAALGEKKQLTLR